MYNRFTVCLAPCFVLALTAAPLPSSAAITKVTTTPSFETAGVIIKLDKDPGNSLVTLEIKGPGQASYAQAHRFVRYDARHMASSLWNLQPATTYSIRINDGASSATHTFTTRAEPKLPLPLRVVKVSTRTALQAAMNAAIPGDEIQVAPGSYAGGLSIYRSGTASAPIVITGVVPASVLALPVEKRTGLPVIEGSGSDFGLIVSGSHVVVMNLRVRNNSKGGIRLMSARSCTVQGCQVYDNGQWYNILISHGGAAAGYNLIQENHVADLVHNTPFSFAHGGDSSVTYYGIRNEHFPGPGTVIRRNRVEQHFDGITPCNNEEEAQNVLESDLDVLAKWHNHDTEVYDNVIVDNRDDAIEADGFCVNARFHRNKLGKSTSPTSVSPALPGPIFFVRNTMTDFSGSAVKLNTAKDRGTIRNIYYYHNTIVRSESGSSSMNAPIYLFDGTPSKLVFFRNNIINSKYRLVLIQEAYTHKPDMDYDLWYSDLGPNAETFIWWGGWKANWSQWKSYTGNEAHGVFANPLLDANLVPKAGSPAIDKALLIPGVNDNYGGKGPDFGAIEVAAPTPPPPPPPADASLAPKDAGVPQQDASVKKDSALAIDSAPGQDAGKPQSDSSAGVKIDHGLSLPDAGVPQLADAGPSAPLDGQTHDGAGSGAPGDDDIGEGCRVVKGHLEGEQIASALIALLALCGLLWLVFRRKKT